MKRVVVDHFGGPEVLKVVEEEDPRPGPGEVLVKVLAAGACGCGGDLICANSGRCYKGP